MKESIQEQIKNIDSALAWVKNNAKNDYRTKFMELVEQRRILVRLQQANDENPALAAFGVSQVGKSYLMGCMLKKDGKPFIFKGKKKDYDFQLEMNPITRDSEATGVVTRFTSFQRYPERYNPDYPVLMKCLSIADVATIISDSYYNDLKDTEVWLQTEIEEEAEALIAKYAAMPELSKPSITADEILEMKAYHIKHLNVAQTLYKSSFFDNLAFVANRIPEPEIADVLSILWHKCESLTKLLRHLMETMRKLRYSRYVYLTEDALVHNSKNENTIMSVQCLNMLFTPQPDYFTDVYLRNGNNYEKITGLSKSEVAALCSEVIVKIDEEYLENTATYNLSTIESKAIRETLRANRDVRVEPTTKDELVDIPMDILRHNDMLDFPGARGREQRGIKDLQQDIVLADTYLRGKVAYLFNVYNESRLINVLFYCHHIAQHDVNTLPDMIHDWIMRYVGETMEKRHNTIESTGVSPFFYIATKFNMDLALSATGANSRTDICGRWEERFNKVLYHKCFKVDTEVDNEDVRLYQNWTAPGEKFGNSYLLRDFKFSENFYRGEKTPERTRVYPPSGASVNNTIGMSDEYYNNLRSTFIESQYVKDFFPNPELSWDAAATLDNDGATLILDRVTTVASRMDKTRTMQFEEILNKVKSSVFKSMQDYVVSTDVDKILEGNIRKAKSIYREMAFTCNTDNYYFGHLLQALQLSDIATYRVLHKAINDPGTIGQTGNFSDYEIIVNDLNNNGFPFDSLTTDEARWNALCETYYLDSPEEAQAYLQSKHVDAKKLFSGSFKRKKTSCILADAVFDFWFDRIKSVALLNEATGNNQFDMLTMNMLTDGLSKSAVTLRLNDYMANEIEDYVNTLDIHSVNESLLADILSSAINRFVLDFGFSMLNERVIEKAREICIKRKLPAFRYIERKQPEIDNLEKMSALFDEMTINPKSLLPSFENNYNSWLEYMFISFVSNIEVPDNYNKEANDILIKLLQEVDAKAFQRKLNTETA